MKSKLLKLAFVASLGISQTETAQAQTTGVFVHTKTGNQSGYTFASVKSLKFDNGTLIVNKTDGSKDVMSLGDVRYINFRKENPTGIEESELVANNFGSNVFPNPLIGNTLSLQFELASSGKVMIDVLDMNGLVQKQMITHGNAGSNEVRWQLDELPAGMYTCRISVGGQIGTKKIVKQ